MSAAPDFASAVAGYRAWQLGAGGVLFPLALPAAPPWEPAVNRARCFAGRRHDSHAAPATHCTCGLHALHDPDDGRLKLGHPAVGVIAAWGEIEVYAAGFRAEYASVIALAHEPSRSTGPPARLREAARRYGVRLVSLADLEAEARELALPLPDAVLPKRQAGTEVTSGECAGGWAGRGEIARWAHGWRACPREALTKRAGIDASVGGITCTRRIGGEDIKLKVGNRVKVEAESTERSPRTGVIEEVVREAPSPRYRIRWDDGHESIYAPAAGAVGPAEPTEKA